MTIIYIYIHVQNAFQITFVPLVVINLHLPVMYIFQLMAVRLAVYMYAFILLTN